MLSLLLIACMTPTAEEVAEDQCDQTPIGRVSLPADEAPHTEAIEWWYWTGHLEDDQGRWYGFEETFFLMQLGFYEATSAHVAVSDLDAGVFRYDVAYVEALLPASTDGFDIDVAGQTAVGANGTETLHGTTDEYTFDLNLESQKPAVFQHGDGYHDYDVGGYTWYYSRERISVAGTLLVGDEPRTVHGEAWMDHQWGNLLSASDAGWDWFALQLDDDREIMLFLVRGSGEAIGGSITDARCSTTELTDLDIVTAGEWSSPVTGCTYPQGWEIDVAGMSLTITPELANAELANDYNTYWEGVVQVSGDATGRGFVELAGYCQ